MNEILLGLTGMGGYAGWWLDRLLDIHKTGSVSARLTAVCEPDLGAHQPRADALRTAGVSVTSSLDEMLDCQINAVILPVPIGLHRAFTEKSLSRGKAVVVEKPAAGSIDDVDAMIAARDRAGLPALVGFQALYDPGIWALKRLLLDGTIGRPVRASIVCCWPRTTGYYSRNHWAGKLKQNNIWILDSPANNALAHPLNMALFLLGSSEVDSAVPSEVEAELYRVNAIENYDTCSIRCLVSGDVPVLTCFTHAAAEVLEPVVTITGETGTATVYGNDRIEIHSNENKSEPSQVLPVSKDFVVNIISGLASVMRGSPRPQVATLQNARAHTLTINAASEASPVHTIAEKYIQTVTGHEGWPLRTIPDIHVKMLTCAAKNQMLGEGHDLAWAMPAGRKSLRGYSHFAGPATA